MTRRTVSGSDRSAALTESDRYSEIGCAASTDCDGVTIAEEHSRLAVGWFNRLRSIP
jgi:hypothetical protein